MHKKQAAITLSVLTNLALHGVTSADGVQVWAWSDIDPAFQDVLTPMVQCFPGHNLQVVADRLKARPAGKRLLILQGWTESLNLDPEDACRKVDAQGGIATTPYFGPWNDHGRAKLRRNMEKFFGVLKGFGVKIDSLVLDNETDFRTTRFLEDNGATLKAIREDPRWPALAARLGFSQLTMDSMWYGTADNSKWNYVLQGDFDSSHEWAVAEPFRALWPDATISNYGSAPIEPTSPIINEAGFPVVRGGHGFGTHDRYEFYGAKSVWLGQANWNGVQLGTTAFDLLRLHVHRVRSIDRASSKPMYPWICSYGLGARGEFEGLDSALSMTPYWRENVIQLVMHGCNTLLLYNPWAWRPQDDPALFNVRSDQELLAQIIRDINARLGTVADPSPSYTWIRMLRLDERVIATARNISGGRLWRFSVAPGLKGLVVPFESGSLQLIKPDDGDTGIWLVESDSNPIALRTDSSDIAFAEVFDEMSWPDLNTDGLLDHVDQLANGNPTGYALAAEVNLVSSAIEEWSALARSPMDAPPDVVLAMRSSLQGDRWGTRRIGPALLALGNTQALSGEGTLGSGLTIGFTSVFEDSSESSTGSTASSVGSSGYISSEGASESTGGSTRSGTLTGAGSTAQSSASDNTSASAANSGSLAPSTAGSSVNQGLGNSDSQGLLQQGSGSGSDSVRRATTARTKALTKATAAAVAQAKAKAAAVAQAKAKAAAIAQAKAKAAAIAQAKAKAAAVAQAKAGRGTSRVRLGGSKGNDTGAR
jgi:hypothetical protein